MVVTRKHGHGEIRVQGGQLLRQAGLRVVVGCSQQNVVEGGAGRPGGLRHHVNLMQEAVVKEMEKLESSLVSGDARASNVQNCQVQHSHVVARVFSATSTRKMKYTQKTFNTVGNFIWL